MSLHEKLCMSSCPTSSDPEEAMEAAVNKRKFLIKRHLKDYSFTEDRDDE